MYNKVLRRLILSVCYTPLPSGSENSMKHEFAFNFVNSNPKPFSWNLSLSRQPDRPGNHAGNHSGNHSRNRLGRVLVVLLLLLFIGNIPAFAQDPDLPGAVANIEQIPAGSLIIPMDNVHQSIGAPFNLKSYGLANKLLQNYIPVKWAIRSNKQKLQGTVTTANATGITLTDANANFNLVLVGDLVTNSSDGFSTGRVAAKISNTVLTITPIAGGLDWGKGDQYVIDGQDFSVAAARIRPLPAIASTTINFTGGPFIVSNDNPQNVARALAIATSFGQNVAVFQTT